jgi:hypothetical protein
MSWRKWLVRLLVFSVLGGCACAVLLYQRWTDPSAVREQVVEGLRRLFPGATVSLDGARLNLFGGIVLSELRLSRRDDPDDPEFLHVPKVVVYHDKEHLLGGKLAFRKVELHRPRLRLQRRRDGSWNLAGLLSHEPPDLHAALPTLVITQGILVLDDRLAAPGTPLLEINDFNCTVINDPEVTVTFEGSGASEELGAVRLNGTWQRDTGAVTLALGAAGIPLTPLLVQRLAAHCPDRAGAPAPFHLEGKAELQIRAGYQPGASQPLHYETHCQVHDARLIHPRIPIPLEKLEASAHCVNGRLTVERLTADSGPARVELRGGTACAPHPEENFEGVLTVRHLPLTEALANNLPEAVQRLHKEYFRPAGAASVSIACARQGGRWLRHHYTLTPENVAICYTGFPYPCDGLNGTIEYDHLLGLTTVNVAGFAGGQPVKVCGTWRGSKEQADVNLEITATGLKVDEKLIKALPTEELRKVAESFHPSGRCHSKVTVAHAPGAPAAAYHNTFLIDFYDLAMKWDGFPYPLEDVRGSLHVYPDHWEFRDFHGTHRGGTVFVRGQTFPQAPADADKEARLLLEIYGQQISLDKDLRDAFKDMPALARAWDTFAPAGRLSFGARIDRVPGRDQDLDITLDVRGCSLQPTFFPYVLHDLSGQLRYHKDQVVVSKFTARHKQTRLSLEKGVVDLYANGGFYADLADLRGNPVVPDEEFLTALPEGLRASADGVKLRDPFAIRTRLVIAQAGDPGSLPDMYWDGQMWVRDAKLELGVDVEDVTATAACVGRHNGRQMVGLSGNVLIERAKVFNQPFHDAHARLLVRPAKPDELAVALYAPAFGGEVSGEALVKFHSDLSYELNLTASQIRLEEFGKHNFGAQASLSGVAGARLHLTGQGSGVGNLEGNGSIDVPYTTGTRLYNLPLLLDLLKFLGLRWPDRTLFEEAHATFAIHGNRANITRLDLQGNVVSLWGRGDVNLDGTDIQLDFYPSWARVEQVLPPVVRSIPPAISKNLLKIEVRGKVTGDPKDIAFHKKPVPGLVDPILQMRDLVSGKKSGGN